MNQNNSEPENTPLGDEKPLSEDTTIKEKETSEGTSESSPSVDSISPETVEEGDSSVESSSSIDNESSESMDEETISQEEENDDPEPFVNVNADVHLNPSLTLDSSYRTSSYWFISLLALVSFVAFFSLHVQIQYLIGENGLLPATEYLERIDKNIERINQNKSIEEKFSQFKKYRSYPTLFWWITPTDSVLRNFTLLGAILSILILLRVFPRLCLGLQFLLYLAITTTSQVFLSFQWDNLILECLFVSIFLPMRSRKIWRPLHSPSPAPAPHPAILFLMKWLLFRLYFESGISKVLSGVEGGWLDLSAMKYYYDTAPLPAWLGIYAHNMPPIFHEWESALTLFVEIILPFAVFANRTIRRVALVIFTSTQIAIILTANYAFFNYIALSLHVFFLDDQDWQQISRPWRWMVFKFFGKRIPPTVQVVALPSWRRWLNHSFLFPVATVLFLASLLSFGIFLLRGKAEKDSLLEKFRNVYSVYQPFRIANAYHLFASMTRERVVIEIQGSNNLNDWIPYRFHYLPGDPKQRPVHVAPHQPRLDFRLWFVAFVKSGVPQNRRMKIVHPYQLWYRTRQQYPAGRQYFLNLLSKLMTDPKSVATFFENMPFLHTPPKYLRLAYYRYHMNDLEAYKETGVFWKRDLIGYDDALIQRKVPLLQ